MLCFACKEVVKPGKILNQRGLVWSGLDSGKWQDRLLLAGLDVSRIRRQEEDNKVGCAWSKNIIAMVKFCNRQGEEMQRLQSLRKLIRICNK